MPRPAEILRVTGLRAAIPALLLGMAWGPSPVHAQNAGDLQQQIRIRADTVQARSEITPVPFGPGEELRYNVKLGVFSVGDGFLKLMSMDTVRGHPTYHAIMQIDGGIPLARVHDRFETWFDVEGLFTRRFIKDQNEVSYKRLQHIEFFPEEGVLTDTVTGYRGPIAVDRPLDDISFIYFVRSLPLEVGDVYYLNRYFSEGGNPVRIEVTAIDTVEVPAGRFETLVVRPAARAKGLFAEGGEAEIHLSNDDRRLLVYMRTAVPVIGSMTLHLERITEGRPLRPGFYTLEEQDLWPDSLPVSGLVGDGSGGDPPPSEGDAGGGGR